MSKNEKFLIVLLAIIAIAVSIYFYKKSKTAVTTETTIVQPTRFVDISKLLIPIAKASIHGASPGANTSILGAT